MQENSKNVYCKHLCFEVLVWVYNKAVRAVIKHSKQIDITQGSYSSVNCIETSVSISAYHILFHEKVNIKSTF